MMVTASCNSDAFVQLVRVYGEMDGSKYIVMLKEHLLMFAEDLKLGWRLIFQQVKYIAKATMEWF